MLLVLPGAALLRTLFPDGGPPGSDSAERVFLAVISSVLLTGLLGFLLAEVGWFSVWLIAALNLAIIAGLWRWSGGDWSARARAPGSGCRASWRPACARWGRGWGASAPRS